MKFLLLFVTVLLFLSCSKQVDYETYSSEEHHFEIDFPLGWDTTNFDVRMDFSAIDSNSDSLDLYPDGFNISVYPNPDQISLDEIVAENLKMANQLFPDAKISESELENANGVKGKSVKMVFSSGVLSLTNKVTFILGHGNLYTLTQSAETKEVEYYDPIFEYVLDSFNWID